jgi:hypothetical protein
MHQIFPSLESNTENTVWDDLRFPATRGQVNPVNSKPDFDTTNVGLRLDPGSEEPIYIVAQLPHKYKAGTNIRPHVHWQATSTDTNTVSMRLQYKWFNNGEVPPAYSNVYKTMTPSGTAFGASATGIAELDGTGKKESSILKIVLTRDATNATTDTYPDDILLDAFDIHFQIEKIGSGPEFPV